MFAVIKSGGRQYKVSVGETLQVNRLEVEAGDQVRFEEVLLISDADNTMIGSPFVGDALVLATATEQGRGEKLIVFRYKSKKRFRHKRGHRQELTFLTIDDIVAEGKSLVTGSAPEYRANGATAVEVEEEEPVEVIAPVEVETTPVDDATPVATTSAEAATETLTPQAEPEKKTRRRRTTKAEQSEEKAEE